MKLTRLQIQNIACFEDLTLDLTDERGNPASWAVLIGENGTGKSTLLQMVGATLLDSKDLNVVASEIDWSRFYRSGSTPDAGTSSINLLPEASDSDYDERYPFDSMLFKIPRPGNSIGFGNEQSNQHTQKRWENGNW